MKLHCIKDFLRSEYSGINWSFPFLQDSVDKWIENKLNNFSEYFSSNELYHAKTIKATLPHHRIPMTIIQSMNWPNEFQFAKYLIGSYLFPNDILLNYTSQDIQILDKIFPKGVKVSKLLKSVVPQSHRLDFEVEYSMAMQKLKTDGKLCLSIHPMDFLTLSNNNNQWTTCFKIPDGDYSAGGLSLMQDSITIVAYIHDPTHVIWLTDHLWNSKIWRQLIHINLSEKWFVQNKSYPFYSALNDSLVSDFIKEVFGFDSCNNSTSDATIINQKVKKNSFSKHYNDIEQMKNILHLHWSDNLDIKDLTPIIVGDQTFCLTCGRTNTDYLICEECC